jgi:hypothetical protein
MKIKLLVELKYDEDMMYGDDEDGKDWFYNGILLRDKLNLYSEEIGAWVGAIKVLEIKK